MHALRERRSARLGLTALGAAVLVLASAIAAGAFSGGPATAGRMRGDLVVGGVGFNRFEVEPGAKLAIAARLSNGGPRGLVKPQIKVLVSLNRRPDRSDSVVGRSSLGRLPGKASRRLRIPVAIPAGMKPGAYWLIVCASTSSPELSRANNCGRGKAQLTVKAATIAPAIAAPPATGPGSPPPGGGEALQGPISARVGACRPVVAVGAQADKPAVVEGEEIEYSASVRNEPAGPCLGVAGAPTVAGEVEVETSVADLAMWIEVTEGSSRSVLPSSSGLTTTGSTAPTACPGGELSGCEATIQEIVGNVFYAEGKARDVEVGSKAEIPFRFFPILSEGDLERIETAPAGAVRLVVAAEGESGALLLANRPLDFSLAQPLGELELEIEMPDGEEQVSEIGPVAAGEQLDVEPAAFYATSEEDPDTVTASFRARAGSPEPVDSSTVDVSTVITNDPASRPAVFPTAAPSAATIGSTPDVLVGVSLVGSVESEPSVVLEGPESVLGALNDEGEAGDAEAGDGIWAGQVPVSMTEDRILRVDVLLDGVERSGQVEIEALPVGAPTEPASTPVPQTIETAQGGSVLADRIVVEMTDGSAYSEVVAAAEAVEGTVAGRIAPGTWQIAIPLVADEAELNAVLAEISAAAGVIGAEPEPVSEAADVVPNDPLYGQQSHLTQIGANKAWIVTRGGSPRVVVAIIDSGVDRDHPDLASRLLPGVDLADGDSNPEDTCGHGTHVAGIVGAATNNGQRVAGVNWNAALLPIKVFPDGAPGSCGEFVNLPAAIRWAVDHGARVINMSLEETQRSEADAQALDYAWNAGRVVVAAAGNRGNSIRKYPAAFERTEQFSSWFGLFKRTYRTDVLAVGNVTSSDVRAQSSNYGSWVDLSAPGSNILSTYLNGGTKQLTGTSMASPVVAGVASLMIGNGVYGPERIRSLLLSTGKPLNQSVGPRVDAFEAVFNGSFEGGLETWLPTGTVGTISRLGPIVPQAGSRMLALSTGPDAAQVRASVDKVMQLRNDALRNGVVNLSLRYDYVTEEYPEFVGSKYNDSLLVLAHLPNGETRVLADESVNATNWTPVSGIDFPGGDSTAGQSGWKTATAAIPASALGGPGDLTIEVFDVGDAIYDSVALVDAVRFE
jgi:subtilisin family serine protease